MIGYGMQGPGSISGSDFPPRRHVQTDCRSSPASRDSFQEEKRLGRESNHVPSPTTNAQVNMWGTYLYDPPRIHGVAVN
jgi:hypothetical protein